MSRKIIPNLLLFVLCAFSFLQAFDYESTGYVKYLYSRTTYPFFMGTFNDQLLHARWNQHLYFGEQWTFALESRWRTYYGNSVQRIPDFKNQIVHHYPFFDLGWTLADESKWFSYLELDRVYLDYQGEKWECTLGRQRIAWGTSLVWNIIDLFNPLSILDFDYEEHPGSDAVRVQYFTGPVSHWEIAYAPAKTWKEQTAAVMWATHTGEYDWFFLLGIKRNRRLAGLAWSGYIKDAGFRGELKISDAPAKGLPTTHPLPFLSPLTANNRANIQAVLSFDYSFSNSLYLHSEARYNRDGVLKNAGFYQWQAADADMLSPARWTLFQEMAYNISPLLRADAFVLYNPNDYSYVIVPSLSWNMATNWDVYVIGFLNHGAQNTEFGAMGKAGFLRLKFSF